MNWNELLECEPSGGYDVGARPGAPNCAQKPFWVTRSDVVAVGVQSITVLVL